MKNLMELYLPRELEEQVVGLITGKINPRFYKSVQQWTERLCNEPTHEEMVMCALNDILDGYGIESIEGEWRNGYWCNIVATYVNMGDSYTATVIHHRDEGFLILSIGDFIERYELVNQNL